jgi:hypothetical protein
MSMEEAESNASESAQDLAPQHEPTQKMGWRHSAAEEVRTHPLGYAVLGIFMLGGPVLISAVFPEAPLKVLLGGGVIFGAFAALMAVPDQFF